MQYHLTSPYHGWMYTVTGPYPHQHQYRLMTTCVLSKPLSFSFKNTQRSSDKSMFDVLTLLSYATHTSSCVIVRVCDFTVRPLQSVGILEQLCQTGRSQTLTVGHYYCPPPKCGVCGMEQTMVKKGDRV